MHNVEQFFISYRFDIYHRIDRICQSAYDILADYDYGANYHCTIWYNGSFGTVVRSAGRLLLCTPPFKAIKMVYLCMQDQRLRFDYSRVLCFRVCFIVNNMSLFKVTVNGYLKGKHVSSLTSSLIIRWYYNDNNNVCGRVLR